MQTTTKTTIHAMPAYGRDYATPDAVIEAWNSNLDFKVVGKSTMLNKQDAEQFGFRIIVLFDNNSQGIVFND